jgi:amino acid adenylation domain-containing protein
LLHRARQVTLDAYAHQDMPFEKLVELLQPVRDPSRTPMFQVAFAVQDAPKTVHNLPGLTLRYRLGATKTSKFDMGLVLEESPNSFVASVEYSTDLFDADRIARMVTHLKTLLENVLANPDQRIGYVSLLSKEEQQQLFFEWNDTTTPYPDELCMHQLFEAQVARTPERFALSFEGERLTYRQLNARANQLAHFLRSLGVGPEVMVGISLDRSLDLLVAVLGVLKAGGAYVPMDPTNPPDRLAFMIEDTQVPILLTQKSIYDLRFAIDGLGQSNNLIVNRQSKIVNLDAEWERIAQFPDTNPDVPVLPDNLAYVIYTSGSTGVPKGVLVPHRGVANLVEQIRPFSDPDGRALLFASLSFDASVLQSYLAWGVGGEVVVARQDDLLPGLPLLRLLQKQRISHLSIVPSALAALPDGELPDLKVIIAGGEVCSSELVARFAAGRSFSNGYGPTETTVWNTNAICTDGSVKPHIGRPMGNSRVYILDARLMPVPIGVPGEVYVGGVGLTRGYHQRPALTAQVFVPNAYGNIPGERLYKSGDLARYRADGNIEFLGRVDYQVKIRGYRIELGEVEAVLNGHAAVRECVVVAREDVAGDKRLVAYVVATPGMRPSVNELQGYLQTKLPQYMVPAAFVTLESLPLTSNNKVDRAALPLPESARPELETQFAAPSSEVERQLAEIWVEVLQLDEVGVHDNFFMLGGHSLLATQVFAKVRDVLSVELPMRALFEAPTIAGLAERVAQLQDSGEADTTPMIGSISRDRYRVNAPAQGNAAEGVLPGGLKRPRWRK